MTRTGLIALGMRHSARWAVGCFGAAPAVADSYWDLEAARANARAGGPVSERDAELLERYGCLERHRIATFCREAEPSRQSELSQITKRRQVKR